MGQIDASFTTKLGTFFSDVILSNATSFANWCMATEPVNYFIMLALVIAIIGIVYRLVRR